MPKKPQKRKRSKTIFKIGTFYVDKHQWKVNVVSKYREKYSLEVGAIARVREFLHTLDKLGLLEKGNI